MCAKKNPCKNGSECKLDAKLKPVCACPPGTKGKKCEKSMSFFLLKISFL